MSRRRLHDPVVRLVVRVVVLLVVGPWVLAGCEVPRPREPATPEPIVVDVDPVELDEICVPTFESDTMKMSDSCADGRPALHRR